jgi:hypothetical protein
MVWVSHVICTNINLVHPTAHSHHPWGFICASIVSMRSIMFLVICFRCNSRWLKLWLCPRMVSVSHVICKNSNLVHPTRLTDSISGDLYVPTIISMRPIIFLVVCFHCNTQWLKLWIVSPNGVHEPCYVYKYKSCVHPTRLADSISGD